ncbi:MAG: ATP-binding protein, partial [bacterium]
LAKHCLEKVRDYSVTVVQSFVECCLALQEQTYDIILLDYHLPNEDGLTILKRLREEKKIEVPVVLVTGHGHEKIAVEAMKAGAFDYVIKTHEYPANLPSIVKTVSEKYHIYKEKKHMEQEIIIRNKELQVLNAISEVVNQSLNLEKILNGAVYKVTELLDLNAGAIYILETSSNELVLQAQKTTISLPNIYNRISSESFYLYDKLIGEGKTILLNCITETPSEFFTELKEADIHAILFVPLKHKTNILGALFLASRKEGFFTERHLDLINSISNQISIAIENANLYLELGKTKNNLENVLNSSLDLIITLRSNGELKFYNDRFAKIYGNSGKEITGENILEYVPQANKKFFSNKLAELKVDKSSIYETQLKRVDGTTMPCIISQSPLKGRDEFLMVIKDISKIVNLQKQLIQTEKLSALGQMISGVAHELNNPLAGILGYSQLLLEDNIPENVRSDLQTILKETTRCQKIVKNLLTFARKQNSDRQHIDINEMLNNILDLQLYQFKVESIRLIKDFDNNLPKIIGDYNQLQQVFLNLVNNAVYALKRKAESDKQLKICTNQLNGLIRIKIIDNGIGISPANKPRIFDPFFTTKEVGMGTGLGLSICFGIIQSHNGNLLVESELGSGSTFIVELSVMEEDTLASSE